MNLHQVNAIEYDYRETYLGFRDSLKDLVDTEDATGYRVTVKSNNGPVKSLRTVTITSRVSGRSCVVRMSYIEKLLEALLRAEMDKDNYQVNLRLQPPLFRLPKPMLVPLPNLRGLPGNTNVNISPEVLAAGIEVIHVSLTVPQDWQSLPTADRSLYQEVKDAIVGNWQDVDYSYKKTPVPPNVCCHWSAVFNTEVLHLFRD